MCFITLTLRFIGCISKQRYLYLLREVQIKCISSRHSNTLWHIKNFEWFCTPFSIQRMSDSHEESRLFLCGHSLTASGWIKWCRSAARMPISSHGGFCPHRADHEAVKDWPPPPYSCPIMSLPDWEDAHFSLCLTFFCSHYTNLSTFWRNKNISTIKGPDIVCLLDTKMSQR